MKRSSTMLILLSRPLTKFDFCFQISRLKNSGDFYPLLLFHMRPETRQSMEMLFSAKWNLPTAANNCGLTYNKMMITLNEYCNFHPPLYKEDGTLA